MEEIGPQRGTRGRKELGVKLSSWPEIGSDGDVLLTPYVAKGITGYDDHDDECIRQWKVCFSRYCSVNFNVPIHSSNA